MNYGFQRFAKRRPVVCLVASLFVATCAAAEEKVTYDDHLAAILRQRCSTCHSGTTKKADLDVTNYLSLMQGGASGAVIEPGDADASYLFTLVTHEAEPFMPQNADKIPDAEIDLLRRWINGGALENKGSQAVKPKSKMIAAVAVAPGAKPEVIPLPPRLVLEPHFRTAGVPMARSLATSPWAPLVAVAGQRQVLLYNTATLELVGVFPFPEGQPNVVRFSRDGALLLAGGGRPAASGKVVVWDVTSGERVFEVGNELDAVLAADISADRSQIALGGPQRVVRVYSTATGELQYEISKHTDWVLSVEFSPDGVLLATADRNGGLLLWEAHTGRDYLTLNGHTGAVTALSWRGDSNLLASGSEDGTVRLWEPENGTQVKTWNAQTGVLSLEFARDGRLATCGRDQVTRLWDQNGQQLAATPPIGEVAVSVTFCDETNRMVAGNWAGAVQVYKSEDAAVLGSLATNPATLAERLQVAEQQLQEKTALRGPLVDALAKAEAEAASAQTALIAAQQESEQLQKAADALAAEASQLTQSRTASDTERNQKATKFTQIQGAMPLISEALRHLTEALAKLPDDKTQAEIHKQLTEKLQKMEAESVELRAKIDELTTTIDTADAKLTETSTGLEAAGKAATAAAERLAALKSQADALVAATEAARQAAQAAEGQVVEAQRQVERWQGEIAFRDRIASLQAQLEGARQAAAERQAEVDKANQELAAVQSTAGAATAKLEEASRGVEQVSAEIRAAREGK
jgi:predicted  nucleic acid-binding Zn-ribbon protein